MWKSLRLETLEAIAFDDGSYKVMTKLLFSVYFAMLYVQSSLHVHDWWFVYAYPVITAVVGLFYKVRRITYDVIYNELSEWLTHFLRGKQRTFELMNYFIFRKVLRNVFSGEVGKLTIYQHQVPSGCCVPKIIKIG